MGINPDNLKVFYTLTRHLSFKHGDWNGENKKKGRVSWEMYQEFGFPTASDDLLVLSCGPDGFNETVKAICEANNLNFRLWDNLKIPYLTNF